MINYIQSIEEAKQIVEQIRLRRLRPEESGLFELFRGQCSESYKLIPSLFRNPSAFATYDSPADMERKLLDEFLKRLTTAEQKHKLLLNRWNDPNLFSWELPAQVQHYGLPTRLLDWSWSWEIALFFATKWNLKEGESNDGQFWVLLPKTPATSSFLRFEYPYLSETCFVKLDFSDSDTAEQETAERRRNYQDGVFVAQPDNLATQPLEEQPDFPGTFQKFIIPGECKLGIRAELATRGFVHDAVLVVDEPHIAELVSEIKAVSHMS
ncbi:MAG: FRG domain-containing protein [Saprospiraceae bacterium]